MLYTFELEQTVRGQVQIEANGKTKEEVLRALEEELANTQTIKELPGITIFPEDKVFLIPTSRTETFYFPMAKARGFGAPVGENPGGKNLPCP